MKLTQRAAAVALAFAVPAILGITAGPAQAAVAPHANNQIAVSHTAGPDALVWKYVQTFASLDECEAVGLAEYESGEALDYKCTPTTTCPQEFLLFLLLNPGSAVAAVPGRVSEVQPAC